MSEIAARVVKVDWGWMPLAATAKGVCLCGLPRKTRREARERLVDELGAGVALLPDAKPHQLLERAAAELNEFFRGERKRFELPLDLSAGTPFQQAVWKAARRIPFGQTRSYWWVAVRAGFPRAARAVGNALHANPVAPLAPCHRVVRSNGLGGFGGGLDLKRRLLRLEGCEDFLE